jgi:hypothetical protein
MQPTEEKAEDGEVERDRGVGLILSPLLLFTLMSAGDRS